MPEASGRPEPQGLTWQGIQRSIKQFLLINDIDKLKEEEE